MKFSLLVYNISGWPAFHQSTVHASPLLYDIDKDGVREIALATYNGEVLFSGSLFSIYFCAVFVVLAKFMFLVSAIIEFQGI